MFSHVYDDSILVYSCVSYSYLFGWSSYVIDVFFISYKLQWKSLTMFGIVIYIYDVSELTVLKERHSSL